jgi:hypothetical protein
MPTELAKQVNWAGRKRKSSSPGARWGVILASLATRGYHTAASLTGGRVVCLARLQPDRRRVTGIPITWIDPLGLRMRADLCAEKSYGNVRHISGRGLHAVVTP